MNAKCGVGLLMKEGGFLRSAILGVFLFGFSLQARAAPGYAGFQANTPTHVSISHQREFVVGEPIRVLARLTTDKGQPLSGQEMALYLDGNYLGQQETDSAGMAALTVPTALPAGKYAIKVVYSGPYAPDTIERELVVVAAEILVETVPPLPGIPFLFEGQTIFSGEDGIARILVNQIGMYQIELLPFEESGSEIHIAFQRWEPESYERVKSFTVPGVEALQVGLEVSYPAKFTFIDAAGETVDPARIATLIARGSNGLQFALESGEVHWLRANTLLRRLSGLNSVTVVYSIQSVSVDGSNVVNQGQQRFSLPADEITLELLLFSATFSAADSLFRFPIGSGVNLAYPDQTTVYYPFDQSGTATTERLARGVYTATIADLPGFSIPIPLVVTRDQVVTLPVISYLDLFAVLLAGILLILIFLRLRRSTWRAAIPEDPDPTRQPDQFFPS